MAVYTPLTQAQIADFLDHAYGRGALVNAAGIAQGVENTNYLLTLRNPAGGHEKLILTLYEKRVDAEDLPFFLELMQHVASHDVACPRPLLRRDGMLFGTCSGKHAAIVSFLEGQSRSITSRAAVEQVGSALGSLHQAARGFSRQRAFALSLAGWRSIYRRIETTLDTIQPGLASLVAHELDYLGVHWPSFTALPHGVIHADLFPDNVFFEGDAVSGLIDFYFACNDLLAYDLAITINAWCFEPDGTWNAEKARGMLAHYQTHRALQPEEKAALPTLLRGAALRFLLTRAHDWIHHDATAIVRPHDPLEYVAKLKFHQSNPSW